VTASVSLSYRPEAVDTTRARWERNDLMARLWRKDPTVWFDPPRPEIDDRLGWLDLPTSSRALAPTLSHLSSQALAEGVTDVVLCGMGGSSLAPEVFARTLPVPDGYPRLTVIDTTHPDAVASVTERTDPTTTWYLVSSKSGGTLETMSLFRHFWARTRASVTDPGSHFLAITDPGSSLEQLARERRFREVVLADPHVGGRYSALSAFGLVPAALIGADVGLLLDAAERAAAACSAGVPLDANPGFLVGAYLGSAALEGRPIAHFSATEPATALPIWIEQLIAESTGKDGRGIVPVDGGTVPSDATDVVTVALGASPDASAEVSIAFDDPYDVAGAMVILEVATAVAGEVLGIHPFDQPDVQVAKTLAHRAMSGELDEVGPDPAPITAPGTEGLVAAALATGPLYVSIQAYLATTPGSDEALRRMRARITDATGRLVTVGYGPRFLHSTGQLHKGGPPGGVFIQVTDDPHTIMPVPETEFTFNELIAGQAAGDRAALAERDRTVVAISIADDPDTGLERLAGLIDRAFD
jgi:transaldolase/glucose-6-phosphate isomerase